MKSFFIVLVLFLNVCLNARDIKVIAFAQDDMANDFRKAQVFEARDEASRYKNIKFIYSDAKSRTSMLIYQIDSFIKQKVDLIIVGTNDAKAVVDVVTKAYTSGIPVIIVDRGINSKKYTTFINSDNIKIGSIGAKFIAKKLKYEGVVLLFEGLLKADVTQLRTKGFLAEMQKYNKIKVIRRTGNYLRSKAIAEMQELLKDKVKVDAIFSQSDSMLSGVRSAMYKFKKDPSSIVMVGCDYTTEAQEAILKGTQTASVKFPLAGKESIQVAVDILEKKIVPKYIVIPVKLVTKENAKITKPIF